MNGIQEVSGSIPLISTKTLGKNVLTRLIFEASFFMYFAVHLPLLAYGTEIERAYIPRIASGKMRSYIMVRICEHFTF